jgi:hypothetical protein
LWIRSNLEEGALFGGSIGSWCMIGQVFLIGSGEYMMGNNCWFNGNLVIERLVPDLLGATWDDIHNLSRNANENYHEGVGRFARYNYN